MSGEGATSQSESKKNQSDSLSLLGVHLTFFDIFIEECGGRDKLQNLTTGQVCDSFIKPRTDATLSLSLCDHLLLDKSPSVGTAQCFISHCWRYNFLDIVDAVKLSFSNKHVADVIVWFDLFSLPQHNRSKIAADWLEAVFTKAISTMQNLLMVLTPWNAPITLTRAWCVFELYACALSNSNFDIAIPPMEMQTFRDSLLENPGNFFEVMSIRSENREATEEDDLLAIQTAIRKSVGFSKLDRMVFALRFDWMVNTLQSHITLARKEGDDVEVARWLFSLGKLYRNQGKDQESESVFVECLETRRAALGDHHRDTTEVEMSLASLYMYQGRYTEAERMMARCLEVRMDILGGRHPDVLDCAQQFALLRQKQGYYEEAESLLSRCMTEAGAIYGEDSREHLTAMHAVAEFYNNLEKYEEAEPLFRGLGHSHEHTIIAINNLAKLHVARKEWEKAVGFQVDCVKRAKEGLGEVHLVTVTAEENLGQMYEGMGDYGKAEPLYRRVVEGWTKVRGPDHARTLAFKTRLAGIYEHQDKYIDAEHLHLEVLNRERDIHGGNDAAIIQSIDTVAQFYIRHKQIDKAEPLLLESLATSRRLREDNDPSSVTSMINFLSEWYLEHDSFKAAEPLCLELLERLERQRGPAHKDTPEPVQKRYLELTSKRLGEDHQKTLLALDQLADSVERLGDWARALELRLEYMTRVRRRFGEDHDATSIGERYLGQCLEGGGRLDEAEELYTKRLERCRRVLGEGHPQTTIQIKHLAEFRERRRQPGTGMRVEDVLEMAVNFKRAGNDLFKKGEYDAANEVYINGLDCLDAIEAVYGDSVELSDAQRKMCNAIRMSLLLNQALSFLNAEVYPAVIKSISTILSLPATINPMDRCKALFRRGLAYSKLHEHHLAVQDLESALKISPRDKLIQRELALARREIAGRRERPKLVEE
ncbi:Kinesin light chain 3 [Rhizophlyctis rosea]|nr:Kinesin light chain 3 [Rhizophlyctis rosea]